MQRITKEVDASFDGKRIYEFLKNEMKLPTTLIKAAKYGGVFIGEECVTMRATLKEGDTVTVVMPEEEGSDIAPIYMPLDVIYEDEYLIAVNKPRNTPTHPSRGNHLPTLAEGLAYYFKDKKFVFRAVGRLDRDTSGIVIVAKDRLSSARLSDSMKAGKFTKIYTALLVGTPEKKRGLIDAPIERECDDSIRRVVRSDGKRALTEYEVISEEGGLSLCKMNLLTGRTHQIRVHAAHIGHPLYNDFLYGEKVRDGSYFLHCGYTSFPHPITEELIEIQCDSDFEKDGKIAVL